MKIEMGKHYRTRDGKEVRIYAVDGAGRFNVHGALYKDGEWKSQQWSGVGKFHAFYDNYDLIEVKPRHVRWIVIGREHKEVVVGSYKEKPAALANFVGGAMACLRIEFEEGEGLE